MKLLSVDRIDNDSCRFTVEMPDGEVIESVCRKHSDELIKSFSYDNAKLKKAIMKGVIDGRQLTKLLSFHLEKNV